MSGFLEATERERMVISSLSHRLPIDVFIMYKSIPKAFGQNCWVNSQGSQDSPQVLWNRMLMARSSDRMSK